MKYITPFFLLLSTLAIFKSPILPQTLATDNVDYGPMDEYLPSTSEMSEWIDELWSFGKLGQYGYRMPGTLADHAGSYYILQRFKQFGLQDTFLEPVPVTLSLPQNWSLTIHANGMHKEIKSHFLRYVAFTSEQGVKAPIVYVGSGSEVEFDAVGDVSGKIVLVDIHGTPTPMEAMQAISLFTYDPGETLRGQIAMESYPPANFDSSYALAGERDAVGYIAIITFMAKDNNQYLHWYFDGSIPGLSVSPADGKRLKDLLASGPVDATMKLYGTEKINGLTHNVYGTVPGKNYGTEADKFIAVSTHHDGWATNDASGVSVLLALAKYFSQFPQQSRENSLLFVSLAGHFTNKKAEWDDAERYENLAFKHILNDRVTCAFVVEMIGKHYEIVDGEYKATGQVSPRGIMVSPVSPFPLADIASAAITKYDLRRTAVLPVFHGESGRWHEHNVPTVGHISLNLPQFSNDDTPETVMVEALRPTTAAFAEMIQAVDTHARKSNISPADE